MTKLALSVPGYGNIPNFPGFQVGLSLGGLVSGFYQIGFFLASFLAFIWFVWGAFQYIFAGGDKEKIAKARSRMTWAIIGLLIVLLAFFVAQFVGTILQPKPGQIPLPGFTLIPTAYAAVDIGEQFGLATEKTQNLGSGLGLLVKPAFSIAGLALVIYFLIGAFKWVSSGGDKEAVSGARKMITHAIVGFVLLMLAFMIFQFILSNLFGITNLRLIQQ